MDPYLFGSSWQLNAITTTKRMYVDGFGSLLIFWAIFSIFPYSFLLSLWKIITRLATAYIYKSKINHVTQN